jgi:hypothetical protein
LSKELLGIGIRLIAENAILGRSPNETYQGLLLELPFCLTTISFYGRLSNVSILDRIMQDYDFVANQREG